MQTTRKQTYAAEIAQIVKEGGHSTNREIITLLRRHFPSVSATTVHRVTQRLADEGVIGRAPMAKDGCLRYDAIASPHDHFICQDCEAIRDIAIAPDVRRRIEVVLDDCRLTGQLTLYGNCYTCTKNHNAKRGK